MQAMPPAPGSTSFSTNANPASASFSTGGTSLGQTLPLSHVAMAGTGAGSSSMAAMGPAGGSLNLLGNGLLSTPQQQQQHQHQTLQLPQSQQQHHVQQLLPHLQSHQQQQTLAHLHHPQQQQQQRVQQQQQQQHRQPQQQQQQQQQSQPQPHQMPQQAQAHIPGLPFANPLQGLGNPAFAMQAAPPLHQQHVAALSEARTSFSGFAAAMQEAKQTCPSDRPDIRSLVSTLERASRSLCSELGRSITKLKTINDSPVPAMHGNPFVPLGQTMAFPNSGQTGNDFLQALASFGAPGLMGGAALPGLMQHSQQGPSPNGMQQQPHGQNGAFDLSFLSQPAGNGTSGSFGFGDGSGTGSGSANANASMLPLDLQGLSNALQNLPPGQLPFGNLGAGVQSPLLPALAQLLSSQDGGRVAGIGIPGNPNGGPGLPAVNPGSSPFESWLRQQQQQSGVGELGTNAASSLDLPAVNSGSNSSTQPNAALQAASSYFGVPASMLEALGLGSLFSGTTSGPAASGSSAAANNAQPASQKRESRDDDSQDGEESSGEDESSADRPSAKKASVTEQQDAAKSSSSTEPKRKKRRHGRGKEDEAATTEASKPSTPAQSAPKSVPMPPRPYKPTPAPGPPTPPVSAAQAAQATNEKKVSTLGVGLRQEGEKRYRNRKLLRDLREHLYRWLGTNEFRKLKDTYKVAEWVPNPHLTEEEKAAGAVQAAGSSSAPPITTHIFHVDFTSRDFYRTNQSLIDAIVNEASQKVEARPESYGIVPGTIDKDHLEDVAKDLMDSARSGFRMSLRTGVQAEKEDKEKHEKYRGVERAKTKCRNREIGAGRLRHKIPKQLLLPGAYSDDAASDEDLHGLTKSEWKRQRLRKLRIAKGWEAVTPKWRNRHLTRAFHKADIVSKSKQMARWRRDDPVELPFPIKLYGKTLPAALFDREWLAEHRQELEAEPYCVKIDDRPVEGWDEADHPLGEDTSDEMEWSDAKDSTSRSRYFATHSASASVQMTPVDSSADRAGPTPSSSSAAPAATTTTTATAPGKQDSPPVEVVHERAAASVPPTTAPEPSGATIEAAEQGAEPMAHSRSLPVSAQQTPAPPATTATAEVSSNNGVEISAEHEHTSRPSPPTGSDDVDGAAPATTESDGEAAARSSRSSSADSFQASHTTAGGGASSETECEMHAVTDSSSAAAATVGAARDADTLDIPEAATSKLTSQQETKAEASDVPL